MNRILIIGGTVAVFILGVLVLQFSPAASTLVWAASQGGAWLLPLVLISSLLDSVHPCSFSILLITIEFLFGLQLSREKILQIGGVYIAGMFAAYPSGVGAPVKRLCRSGVSTLPASSRHSSREGSARSRSCTCSTRRTSWG